MFFNKIFKKADRRKVENHRKSITINPKYIESIGFKRPKSQERGSDKDRKSDVGSRSGIYYKLSDKKKNTVDNIIERLEMESMEKGNFDIFS